MVMRSRLYLYVMRKYVAATVAQLCCLKCAAAAAAGVELYVDTTARS